MTTEEMCQEAGFTREMFPDVYDRICADIEGHMGALMSKLSATMGLSWERVRIYSEQEKVFIEDLRIMVSEHTHGT